MMPYPQRFPVSSRPFRPGKRMTLIAALPCAENAVVLFSDSQETYGDGHDGQKTHVNKLIIERLKWMSFAYAAAGGVGELVDGLGDAIKAAIAVMNPESDKHRIEATVRQAVIAYHASDEMKLHQSPVEDRRIEGFVCVSDAESVSHLFRIRSTVVTASPKRFAAGSYPPIYELVLDRFYRPDMPVQQAVLLGLHLFAIAETSNYIGGKISVAVAWNGRILRIADDVITDLKNRVDQFLTLTDSLYLACADTSLTKAQFRNQLEAFTSDVEKLRAQEVTAEAWRDVASEWDYRSPYPALPQGASVMLWGAEIGGRVAVFDPGETPPAEPPAAPAVTTPAPVVRPDQQRPKSARKRR